MDAKLILDFLRQVAMNNNRPWFQEHKAAYEAAKMEFERGVAQALEHYVGFDDSLAHLQVKDCTYRFYRDTRFSPDKSPYKNHMGAYISARGKKSLHSGGLWQLLAAHQHTDLVPQRNHGQYRRVAAVCGVEGVCEIFRRPV